jgi:2-keto-4-pentenoate hydratase/2-oxohepta-3-ene-1,7-dioic acid hydratase in catechol pathway
MTDYRLVTYKTADGARAGVVIGEQVYDAAAAARKPQYASVLGILRDWKAANALLSKASYRKPLGALKKMKLLAPLPDPVTLYCAGANYTDHMAEMARAQNKEPGPNMKDLGEKPWHFIKNSGSVVGPNAVVKIPPYTKALDWEVELGAVIGRKAKDVPAEKALSYVAGYTIANDLSARDVMRREKVEPTAPFRFDWVSQKCFDGACPLGPWIVPAAQVGDPQSLGLKLWVNDELMQDSHTSKMIFSTAEQIEMLSSRVTLQPGDIVLTGTPAGVGMPRGRFLKPGDKVRLWIEKIGELSQRMA